MGNVLEESLPLIMPHLPRALMADERSSAVWEAALNLVPLPRLRLGFECRLSQNSSQVDSSQVDSSQVDSSQVDVQQGIVEQNGEPALLADFLDETILGISGSARLSWNRLRDFCTMWQQESSLFQRGVQEIWLEFDVVGDAAENRLPCIFLSLQEQLSTSFARFAVVEGALPLLTGKSASPAQIRNIGRCFDGCGEEAVVSHFGIMHLRPTQAYRINVKWPSTNGSASQIRQYLHQISWPGDFDELETLLDWLSPLVDEMRLCLDVGEDIHPSLGLECFVTPTEDSAAVQARWRGFLAVLVEKNLCSGEKCEALLSWPGWVTPATASVWPTRLLIDSLIGDGDTFTSLHRQLNHVKLAFHPRQPLHAKGYLIVEHKQFRL